MVNDLLRDLAHGRRKHCHDDDDDDDENGAALEPMPAPSSSLAQPVLQSNTNLVVAARVGAFRGAPGAPGQPVVAPLPTMQQVAGIKFTQYIRREEHRANANANTNSINSISCNRSSGGGATMDPTATFGLAQAQPVDPTQEQDRNVARPVDRKQANDAKQRRTQSRRLRCAMATLVLVAVAAGLVLVVVLAVTTTTASEEEPTPMTLLLAVDSSADSTNAKTIPAWLSENAPWSTLQVLQTETSSSSPQFRALQWLQQDPSFHAYSIPRRLQRFALATLFYATNNKNNNNSTTTTMTWKVTTGNASDPNTRNHIQWLSYQGHECDWYTNAHTMGTSASFGPPPTSLEGLPTTNCVPDHASSNNERWFHSLVLLDNGLVGTLPDELALLTHMRRLYLPRNEGLGGTLPQQVFSQWPHLEDLGVFKTSIRGILPVLPTRLRRLEMFMTKMVEAPFPIQLYELSSRLEMLVLARSRFRGPLLPHGVANWTNSLHTAVFRSNQLSGEIPSEFGGLAKLKQLALGENEFHGPLPSELGQLSQLTGLSVFQNRLDHQLPSELGNLVRMMRLDVGGNQFSQSLPSELGRLSQLTHLTLSGNVDLTGTLPAELEGLATSGKLQTLDLTGTSISGSIPSGLCVLPNLEFDCGLLCGCSRCNCSRY